MSYAFNGLIRFSKENNFNAPFSYTERDSSTLKQWILKTYKTPMKIICSNNSYEQVIDINKLSENDFIYLDPPYSNTTAVYNENRLTGWSIEEDNNLFKFLEELNSKGIKWAMSNVFSNNEMENKHLIEWCEKNKWYVRHLNITYSNFGKKDKQNDEVLIMNYDPVKFGKYTEQLSLF